MNPNTNPKKVLLALKRAIEATFTSSDWEEIGLDTNCDDIINEDHRLYRSLDFGDDDYGLRVMIVLEQILKRNPKNLNIIEEYVSLEKWLKEHEPRLHEELYETGSFAMSETEEIGTVHNLSELTRHILRIRRSIKENDPSQSIGSSKELLESVLKTILEDLRQDSTSHDIPTLLKLVQQQLEIDPTDETTKKLNEKVKRTLNNLGQVVVGVAEIRNLVGTGHGRTEKHDIDPNHALLIINSVGAICPYLINLWQEKKKQNLKT